MNCKRLTWSPLLSSLPSGANHGIETARSPLQWNERPFNGLRRRKIRRERKKRFAPARGAFGRSRSRLTALRRSLSLRLAREERLVEVYPSGGCWSGGHGGGGRWLSRAASPMTLSLLRGRRYGCSIPECRPIGLGFPEQAAGVEGRPAGEGGDHPGRKTVPAGLRQR